MANLLDEASILLTPTASDDGKLLSVIPSEPPYGDFEFDRNSSATRVNAQGLVEDVQILSGDLVQNGDFSEIGAEEVSNGSFSQEGSEQIVNGDFATDSDWTKGTGWSIGGGTANCDGTQTAGTSLTQNGTYTVNKIYKITYTVEVTSGSVDVRLQGSGATVVGNARTTSGTYTDYLVSTGNTSFRVRGNSIFVGSIDNVSVREVGQDWTLGTGWSIGEDKASKVSGVFSYLLQPMVLPTPNTYKVTFTVSDYVSGDVKWGFTSTTTSPFGTPRTANGTYTEYFTHDSNAIALRFRASSTFEGSITNISVKEVGQNWSFGDGFTPDQVNSKATCDGTQTAVTNLQQTITTNIQNQLVRVSFTLDYTAGLLLGSLSGTGGVDFNNITSSGTYTAEMTSNEVSPILTLQGDASFIGSITNVIIKSVTNDTNLPRINYDGFSYDGSGAIIPNSGCGSWLFEPQSTNLITQSEDFSDASWTGGQTNATVTASTNVNPSGNSGTYLVERVTGSQLGAVRSVTAGLSYTGSFYVRNVSGSGAITLRDVNSVTTPFTATSEWQRFSVTGVATGAGRLYINVLTPGDIIEVWGAQLEQQSYATSYIPTEGTTKTRNQDVCNNGGDVSLINSTEGTLYAEISALADDLTNRSITLSDGSTQNYVMIRFNSNNSNWIYTRVNLGGTFEYFNINSNNVITDYNKIAIRYQDNNFATFINGVKVFSQLSGSAFGTGVLTTLNFNSGFTASDPFFGKTKALAVWKTALSDTELAELTTI